MSDSSIAKSAGEQPSTPSNGEIDPFAVSNAQDDPEATNEKLLIVGPHGAGKTTQIITLPGKKFAYFFDPNGKRAIRGYDVDYVEFVPEPDEIDWAIKAFNKDSRPSDKMKDEKDREPRVYNQWVEDINRRYDAGFFDKYNWLCIDSLSLQVRAVINRILFVNKRFGDIEELSDYRVAGNKLAEIFIPITSIPHLNLYCTGHIAEKENSKTKKISTELDIPGASRSLLPKMFSHILELRQIREDEELRQYNVLTRADIRGYQGLRCAFHNVEPVIDMTIKDFKNPEDYGIGAFLARNNPAIAALRSSNRPIPPAITAKKPGQVARSTTPIRTPVKPPSTSSTSQKATPSTQQPK